LIASGLDLNQPLGDASFCLLRHQRRMQLCHGFEGVRKSFAKSFQKDGEGTLEAALKGCVCCPVFMLLPLVWA
jgi:hypothetical protein